MKTTARIATFSGTDFLCDICNAPMVLTRTIGTKESGKKYRQRWYKCSICEYQKKINGSGYHSEVEVPHIIEKQQEEKK